MSTYGDRGNIVVLTKRCEWRGIGTTLTYHTLDTDSSNLLTSDIIFMGGAQDRQQKIVSENLQKKAKTLKKIIDQSIPGLYICGAYQFLGNFYKTADGIKLPGLEIFDVHTVHPGDQGKRLIGNIVTSWKTHTLVGFENHGGRTFLGNKAEAFGKVVKGFGNNGEDGTEGVLYKNSIGTYLHGPLLPKNPELADWILEQALKIKYQKEIKLAQMDISLEKRARNVIFQKLNVEYNNIV
jgi:hypothetical protein